MDESCLIISEDNVLINKVKTICDAYNVGLESLKGPFEALELIRLHKFVLIIIDNRLSSVISNKELVRFIRKSDDALGIFLLTDKELSFAEKDDFLNNGVSEIFIGDSALDIINDRINNILFTRDIEANLRKLTNYLYAEYGFDHIIGNSTPMMQLFDSFTKLKNTDVTIFIHGESGTGKEILAKEIHKKSLRSKNNFVAINCAAIPENLLESELFGHEKGSFTGASDRRIGKFELAAKGTIFLDEIGEMPIHTQSKILRALEEREIERIGGNEKINVDVRIITATNRDLEAEVESNNFRNDLLYRINVFPLYLPPLRERENDIEYLTIFFFKKLREKNKKNIISINPKVFDILKSYNWPGNIRELENVLERSIILCNGSELTPEYLQIRNDFNYEVEAKGESSDINIGDRIYPFEKYEKMILEKVLDKCGGNIKKASELLKIGRSTFHRKILKYGLTKK